MNALVIIVVLLVIVHSATVASQNVTTSAAARLSTNSGTSQTGIHGFAINLHCAIENSCADGVQDKLSWYKDGVKIFDGLVPVPNDAFAHNELVGIRHEIHWNTSHDCASQTCSDADPVNSCGRGRHCLENRCCTCASEEYTLMLRNLSAAEHAGEYLCKLQGDFATSTRSQYRAIELKIQEGIFPKNFSFDTSFTHEPCCREQGMKPECLVMCKPHELVQHTWNPMACLDDIPKMLHCATDGGNISHVDCCRRQMVPPFCFEFCSGNFRGFRSSHQLCTYHMRDIFECYERAFYPYPMEPEDATVDAVGEDKLRVCWKQSMAVPNAPIHNYTVHYKEIPRLPFLGGFRGLFPPRLGSPRFPPRILPGQPRIVTAPPQVDTDEDDYEVADDQDYFVYPDESGPPVQIADLHSNHDQVERQEAAASAIIGLNHRQKRQHLMFITHNHNTNQTVTRVFTSLNVRSLAFNGGVISLQGRHFSGVFRLHELQKTVPVNASVAQQCTVLDSLRPGSQYSVHVTAANKHGSSYPSVRSLANTWKEPASNVSTAGVYTCCQAAGVSHFCAEGLCKFDKSLSAIQALHVSAMCRNQYPKVAPCLAAGRNVTPCCTERGVKGDCMQLCDGSAATMGLSSVLCLTLDLPVIQTCLKQGYEHHATPPRNMTVDSITDSGAVVRWAPPDTNHDKVTNYSLFLQKKDLGAEWHEIMNARSPHRLEALDESAAYRVYVVAHTEHGSSLQSNVEEFFTGDGSIEHSVCPDGSTGLIRGRSVFMCRRLQQQTGLLNVEPHLEGTCPQGYYCHTGMAQTDIGFCCYDESSSSLPDFEQCCEDTGVKEAEPCKSMCTYNITAQMLVQQGPACMRHVHHWVRCGVDGRDHRPCCLQRGVPEHCSEFCTSPFAGFRREHLNCMPFLEPVLKCITEGVLKLPGPATQFKLVSIRVSNLKATLNLTWAQPMQDEIVDKYWVRVFRGNEATPVKELNVTATAASVEGLDTGSEYTVNVVSVNEHGSSVPTNNITVTPIAPNSGRPASRPSAPHSVRVVFGQGDMYNLTWKFDGLTADGKPLPPDVTFKVHHREHLADTGNRYTEVSTKRQWIMLELVGNRVHDVFVQAVKDIGPAALEGDPSEVIIVTTAHGLNRLPDPVITVTPDQYGNTYNEGDNVSITCEEQAMQAAGLDSAMLELRIPGELHRAEVRVNSAVGGLTRVQRNVSASRLFNHENIECLLMSSDFVPARAEARLNVRFGPEPHPVVSVVSTYSLVWAKLTCRVLAFPTPQVHWYYVPTSNTTVVDLKNNATRLSADFGEFRTAVQKNSADRNALNATLEIQPTKNLSGTYYCNACASPQMQPCQAGAIRLIVNDIAIPDKPLDVEACCESEGVAQECCFGSIAYRQGSKKCRDDANTVKCMKDGVDHRVCCGSMGVPSRCLSTCDMRFSQSLLPALPADPVCSVASGVAFACAVRNDRRRVPNPQHLSVQLLDSGGVDVSWGVDPFRRTRREEVNVFVVYYKPKADGDDKWLKERTTKQMVVLTSLLPFTQYDLYVLAMGETSYSKFVKLDEGFATDKKAGAGQLSSSRGPGGGSSRRGSATTALLLMLLAALVAVAALWVLGVAFRRKKYGPQAGFLPFDVASLSRRSSPSDPSVAFENPAYTGREPQITGLPEQDGTSEDGTSSRSNWTTADLESIDSQLAQTPPETPASPGGPPQKGMQYARLK